jgi:hypothetical protein
MLPAFPFLNGHKSRAATKAAIKELEYAFGVGIPVKNPQKGKFASLKLRRTYLD